MAPLACPNCTRLNHFEVRVCPQCSATVGYDPASDQLLHLADELTAWRDGEGQVHDVVVCANNNEFQICNWLVPPHDDTPYCRACRHNRTIPDLTAPDVPARWAKIEAAKRRMMHTLLRLGLPVATPDEAAAKGAGQGFQFDFLYDPASELEGGSPNVLTGHDGGLITLNIVEADDAKRERMRTSLGEPYRTLLGHFRHEVGHHYWNRLVQDDPEELALFREIMGDETVDYGESLSKHYGGNDNSVWPDEYISFYATSHPWEDFAETFAHYLHMVDALATLGGFGMKMEALPGDAEEEVEVSFDPYRASARRLLGEWVPFSFAENAISRSMGQPDLYPFHLSEPVIAKLEYMAGLLKRGREKAAAGK